MKTQEWSTKHARCGSTPFGVRSGLGFRVRFLLPMPDSFSNKLFYLIQSVVFPPLAMLLSLSPLPGSLLQGEFRLVRVAEAPLAQRVCVFWGD